MAANSQNDADDEISGINITPLVDIMLVLLIIFMVTANFVNHKSINIELPRAATGEDSKKTKSLGFTIDKESRIYIDGTRIESKDLSVKIKEYVASNSNVSALIAADKATPHGAVVKVIDALRLAGVINFSLNIDPEVLE